MTDLFHRNVGRSGFLPILFCPRARSRPKKSSENENALLYRYVANHVASLPNSWSLDHAVLLSVISVHPSITMFTKGNSNLLAAISTRLFKVTLNGTSLKIGKKSVLQK